MSITGTFISYTQMTNVNKCHAIMVAADKTHCMMTNERLMHHGWTTNPQLE